MEAHSCYIPVNLLVLFQASFFALFLLLEDLSLGLTLCALQRSRPSSRTTKISNKYLMVSDCKNSMQLSIEVSKILALQWKILIPVFSYILQHHKIRIK